MAKSKKQAAVKGDSPSVTSAILELERVYTHFAPRLELQDAPRPVVMIQSAGRRKNMLGWMAPEIWQQAHGKGQLNEITVVAEYLSRGPEAAAETMLHEMCHHSNALKGVRDCNSAQYHNKKFKDVAEQLGLVVEKMGNKGYAKTALGPELLKEVKALKLDPEAFAVFRLLTEREKQPTKMKKWECGCTIVRCATDLEATCNACGETFEQAE